MQPAIFNFFWQGAYRPIHINPFSMANLDTGRVDNEAGWTRCIVSFAFDGATVTMQRHTEYWSDKCASSTSGKWACPADKLLANTVKAGDLSVLIPAWVDAKETSVVDLMASAAGY